MARQNLSSLNANLSPTKRYGLSVVSVALSLGLALPLERYDFRGVEFPLFLFAIALTVWYAGPCPGIPAVVLSSLPEQQSDQIFNAFFTTKRQGIGMGLSISRSIVELYGGRLWAEKNTGCGTIFLFSLPAAHDTVI